MEQGVARVFRVFGNEKLKKRFARGPNCKTEERAARGPPRPQGDPRAARKRRAERVFTRGNSLPGSPCGSPPVPGGFSGGRSRAGKPLKNSARHDPLPSGRAPPHEPGRGDHRHPRAIERRAGSCGRQAPDGLPPRPPPDGHGYPLIRTACGRNGLCRCPDFAGVSRIASGRGVCPGPRPPTRFPYRKAPTLTGDLLAGRGAEAKAQRGCVKLSRRRLGRKAP